MRRDGWMERNYEIWSHDNLVKTRVRTHVERALGF
jgi:hypothetical protein